MSPAEMTARGVGKKHSREETTGGSPSLEKTHMKKSTRQRFNSPGKSRASYKAMDTSPSGTGLAQLF